MDERLTGSNAAKSTDKIRAVSVCKIKWHKHHVDLGGSCYPVMMGGLSSEWEVKRWQQ